MARVSATAGDSMIQIPAKTDKVHLSSRLVTY